MNEFFKYNNRTRKAFEGFMELLNKEGYKLLDKYIKSNVKVELECNKGHKYKVTPSNFKNGRRCPVCAGNSAEQAKINFIELLNKEGYKLLDEYTNSITKVELECNKGHKYKVTPSNFKNGRRCPVCYGKSVEQSKINYTELLNKEGYKLLYKYIKSNAKVELECNKGHKYKSVQYNLKREEDFKFVLVNCLGKYKTQKLLERLMIELEVEKGIR